MGQAKERAKRGGETKDGEKRGKTKDRAIVYLKDESSGLEVFTILRRGTRQG